jgi:hypothetical protein
MSENQTLSWFNVANREIHVVADVDEKPKAKAFPLADVKACLLAELTDLAQSEAQVRGLDLPTAPKALLKMAIPLDSLSVVAILCEVEPILKFELRDSIVKTGGFSSIEAALDYMLPRIEKAWVKKNGVAT